MSLHVLRRLAARQRTRSAHRRLGCAPFALLPGPMAAVPVFDALCRWRAVP